jgi:hypothetical protein
MIRMRSLPRVSQDLVAGFSVIVRLLEPAFTQLLGDYQRVLGPDLLALRDAGAPCPCPLPGGTDGPGYQTADDCGSGGDMTTWEMTLRGVRHADSPPNKTLLPF